MFVALFLPLPQQTIDYHTVEARRCKAAAIPSCSVQRFLKELALMLQMYVGPFNPDH